MGEGGKVNLAGREYLAANIYKSSSFVPKQKKYLHKVTVIKYIYRNFVQKTKDGKFDKSI